MSINQPRKPAGLGTLLLILGALVALPVLAIIGLTLFGISASKALPRHGAVVSTACAQASHDEERAANEVGAGEWQMGYNDALSGLHVNGGCQDDKAALVNRAYLMTMKAWSEHRLSLGDSVTDMNEATTLLEECQTTPGLYGTHVGAQCETQQDANIREKDNWEMSR